MRLSVSPLMPAAMAAAAVALSLWTAPASAEPPAKELFGAVTRPADMPSRVLGFYAKGCLAGAEALPVDGPAWQVMRLSRNRNWGNPRADRFLEKFARAGAPGNGWPGILVGDIVPAARRADDDGPCLAPDRPRCGRLADPHAAAHAVQPGARGHVGDRHGPRRQARRRRRTGPTASTR